MLFRLSRILFWMAAAAAATALFGPTDLATPLTALAGLGVLAAYALARIALRRDRRAVAAIAPDSTPARLHAAALADIALRLNQATAEATSLEVAALAAAATLRAELGAREATVHRVRAVVPPFVDLVTITADGLPGIEHRVRLERSPLGEAIREGRVAGAGDGPFGIPVRGPGGRWAAVIELGVVALQAEPGGLEALFERLAGRLAQLARADAAGVATLGEPCRDILTPGGDSEATPSWAQGGGCRTQYPETVVTPESLPAVAVSVSPNRSPAPAQLDAQALEKLRELDPKGENQLIERVLRAFETSVERLLPQLEAARSSGDRAGVRHVAHTLKSSSASIGALALSQHCAAVETLIRENSADDLQAPLTALVAELDAVRQAIRSMLDPAS
jgi:HPt (histidine-containing phosphotransfer) domain-containing protein